MVTRCKTFGPTSSVADTKTQVGSDYTLPAGTRRISAIIASLHSETASESLSGYVTIEIDSLSGPFEFPLCSSLGIATSGGGVAGPAIIPVDMPIPGAGVVKVYVTMEHAVECHIGLVFE